MAETWLHLAQEARRAASRLMTTRERLPRSCIARAYYAAYSKVAHELVSVYGLTMPNGQEGPHHPGKLGTGGIRRMIVSGMVKMTLAKRIRLSELVGRLYTLRIDADYRPSVDVDDRDARVALSIMNTVFDSF